MRWGGIWQKGSFGRLSRMVLLLVGVVVLGMSVYLVTCQAGIEPCLSERWDGQRERKANG